MTRGTRIPSLRARYACGAALSRITLAKSSNNHPVRAAAQRRAAHRPGRAGEPVQRLVCAPLSSTRACAPTHQRRALRDYAQPWPGGCRRMPGVDPRHLSGACCPKGNQRRGSHQRRASHLPAILALPKPGSSSRTACGSVAPRKVACGPASEHGVAFRSRPSTHALILTGGAALKCS